MKTDEELVALGRKLGVAVTITTKPPGTGEIAPLPGFRRPHESHEFAPERDDDGTGLVE